MAFFKEYGLEPAIFMDFSVQIRIFLIMFDAIKKYNNRVLDKKEKKELNALLKDLPPEIEVKIWNWHKHTRIALIKDGYQV